ncbi:MAG: glycosyltransferase family 39 protein [Ignavibacteriales bacterium]|nr:glycosyltransferase family 39 protein [Ignavibacteriales bacterium]
MSNRKYFSLLALAFFLAIVIHILFLVNGFFATSADESGRTLDAYFWITNNAQLSDVWLPFYRILLGNALLLYHDLFIVPRIISFLFGIGVLGIIVWLTNELFQKKEIAIVAALLTVIFPSRIILSVVPLTEIIFIFFILCAFTFYIRWCNTKKNLSLILASVFFGITTTIRYEGWLFAFVFLLFLLYRKFIAKELSITFTAFILICILLCSFPLYWVVDNALREGSPLYFLTKTSTNYERMPTSFLKLIWRNVASQFIVWNLLSLNILGAVAIFLISQTNSSVRQMSVLMGIPFFLVALFQLFGHTLPTHNPWRIASVWGVLLLPFTSYFVREKYFLSSKKYYSIAILFIVLCFGQTLYFARHSYFTQEEKQAGEFLEQHNLNESHQRMLIENPDWYYLNIMVASQHPKKFLFNSGFNPYEPKQLIVNTELELNKTLLQEKQIDYLVMKSPRYKNFLSQYSFIQKEKDFGEWSIYKFIKENKQ